jgi:thiol-disulfide isomerase/thioredoxin
MKYLFLSLALAAGLPCAPAAELGQPAARLKITDWIKGKPVDLAAVKGKQVVVVEFWATWCAPCRTSIPHLTALQKKFPDVVFLGVSDEEAATVKKFVTKLGEQMDYTVAIDDHGKTTADYLEAFGQSGIPHAFIVDKEGRVVWIGHPMDGLEEALAEVLAGKFDLDKARKRAGAESKMNEFYEAALEGTDEAKIERMGRELEALDAEVGGLTPGQKFSAAEVRKSAKFRSLLRDYQLAIMGNKGGTNLARIERLLAENAPADFNLAEFKESTQLNQLFNAYCREVTGRNEPAKVAELAGKLREAKPKDPRVLSEWAWTIATDERVKQRDYALAIRLAQAAVDASGGKDAGILDICARATFDSGQTAEGIAWQQKAIAAAGDDETKKELGETLKKYEAKVAAK